MEEDKKNRVNQLERENMCLKRQIRELEEKKNSQEIIIDALVEQTKKLRETNKDYLTERKKGTFISTHTEQPIEINSNTIQIENTSMFSESNIGEKALTMKEPEVLQTEDVIETLTKQIITIFQPKEKNVDFKANSSFQKFVDYAESTFEFSLMNKKIFKAKNPLKMYIESNLEKIVKYLIDNINQFNLNQICSTFFLINSAIEYKHKLVIVHDCIVEISQYSKLPYLISALFNNHELENDILSIAISKILYHQCYVDKDIFADEEVQGYLALIEHNFSLEKPTISLWETPVSMLESVPMFNSVNGAMRVSNECIMAGFTIRAICHYLDWEYTYNTFIVETLGPRLKEKGVAVHAYYLGILAIDAYKAFGKHESVELVFQELLSIMGNDSDLSVICFLITKQFYEAEAECWFDNNISLLEKRGFSRKYLSEFLLL
ncbi:hypothetical protein PAEPH01_0110 [Pancytospora epiphaga]|nr:hypothetical protein PAEPH01_0110 [Pancytospora epiphaga]